MDGKVLGKRNGDRRTSLLAVALFVGFMALMAAGCCWLAAGAGAGAGYKVGTDERSIGDQVSDAGITAQIKSKLLTERGIRSLNVDVDCVDGHVIFNGIVKSEEQVQRIVQIARSVEGVKGVTSNLRVRP